MKTPTLRRLRRTTPDSENPAAADISNLPISTVFALSAAVSRAHLLDPVPYTPLNVVDSEFFGHIRKMQRDAIELLGQKPGWFVGVLGEISGSEEWYMRAVAKDFLNDLERMPIPEIGEQAEPRNMDEISRALALLSNVQRGLGYRYDVPSSFRQLISGELTIDGFIPALVEFVSSSDFEKLKAERGYYKKEILPFLEELGEIADAASAESGLKDKLKAAFSALRDSHEETKARGKKIELAAKSNGLPVNEFLKSPFWKDLKASEKTSAIAFLTYGGGVANYLRYKNLLSLLDKKVPTSAEGKQIELATLSEELEKLKATIPAAKDSPKILAAHLVNGPTAHLTLGKIPGTDQVALLVAAEARMEKVRRDIAKIEQKLAELKSDGGAPQSEAASDWIDVSRFEAKSGGLGSRDIDGVLALPHLDIGKDIAREIIKDGIKKLKARKVDVREVTTGIDFSKILRDARDRVKDRVMVTAQGLNPLKK